MWLLKFSFLNEIKGTHRKQTGSRISLITGDVNGILILLKPTAAMQSSAMIWNCNANSTVSMKKQFYSLKHCFHWHLYLSKSQFSFKCTMAFSRCVLSLLNQTHSLLSNNFPVKCKRLDGLDIPRCELDTQLTSNDRNTFLIENSIYSVFNHSG